MERQISLRIAGNTAVNLIGQVLSRLFDVLTFLILARYLGVDDFGKFSFVFAFVSLFSMLIDWGTSFILIRKTSTPGPARAEILGNGMSLRLCLSLLAVFTLWAFVFILGYPPQTRILVVLASASLLISFRMSSFRDIFEVPLISALKMKYSALAAVLNRLLTFLVILSAIKFQASLGVIVALYTLIALPPFILLAGFSRKVLKPVFNMKPAGWLKLLKEGFPLALGGAFFILFSQLDMFLLSRFWSESEMGFYSASRRITEPLELIPVALSLSLIPVMSRLFGGAVDPVAQVRKIFNKSLLFLVLTVAPLAVFLAFFAKDAIGLLFGKAFLPASSALILLSCYLPFIFIWHICGAVFIAMKKQKMTSIIWLIAFLFNLSLNLVIIPRLGFFGASLARLATGALVAILSLAVVKHLLGKIEFHSIWRLAVFSFLLVVVLKILAPVNILLAVFVAAVIYVAGVLIFRIIQPEDIRLIKEWLIRRPENNERRI
jgi:O-antigen/teichoic acid export membrane protein